MDLSGICDKHRQAKQNDWNFIHQDHYHNNMFSIKI